GVPFIEPERRMALLKRLRDIGSKLNAETDTATPPTPLTAEQNGKFALQAAQRQGVLAPAPLGKGSDAAPGRREARAPKPARGRAGPAGAPGPAAPGPGGRRPGRRGAAPRRRTGPPPRWPRRPATPAWCPAPPPRPGSPASTRRPSTAACSSTTCWCSRRGG